MPNISTSFNSLTNSFHDPLVKKAGLRLKGPKMSGGVFTSSLPFHWIPLGGRFLLKPSMCPAPNAFQCLPPSFERADHRHLRCFPPQVTGHILHSVLILDDTAANNLPVPKDPGYVGPTGSLHVCPAGRRTERRAPLGMVSDLSEFVLLPWEKDGVTGCEGRGDGVRTQKERNGSIWTADIAWDVSTPFRSASIQRPSQERCRGPLFRH